MKKGRRKAQTTKAEEYDVRILFGPTPWAWDFLSQLRSLATNYDNSVLENTPSPLSTAESRANPSRDDLAVEAARYLNNRLALIGKLPPVQMARSFREIADYIDAGFHAPRIADPARVAILHVVLKYRGKPAPGEFALAKEVSAKAGMSVSRSTIRRELKKLARFLSPRRARGRPRKLSNTH